MSTWKWFINQNFNSRASGRMEDIMKLKDVTRFMPSHQLLRIKEDAAIVATVLPDSLELKQYLNKTVSQIYTDKAEPTAITVWVYDR